MGPSLPFWRLLPLFLLSLLPTLGCASLRIVDRSSSSSGDASVIVVVTPPTEQHDVAVTGVTFEPPSGPESPEGSRAASLLAVVTNQGNQSQTQVTVHATLVGSVEGRVLAERSVVLERLAPGESALVRLGEVSGLPLEPKYVLTVRAVPVPGESNLANNSKSFEVHVSVTAP